MKRNNFKTFRKSTPTLTDIFQNLNPLLLQANAILAAGLDVFKSTEPGQVHIYHDKSCDSKVLQPNQLKDCRNSRAAHYGPKSMLYFLWTAKVLPQATTVSNRTVVN